MLFCPTCANLLIIGDSSSINKCICQTCPYEFPITKQYTSRAKLNAKNVGVVRDVLKELEEGAARTEVECQSCGHGYAYFKQLQTRSADEPMTIYYKYVLYSSVIHLADIIVDVLLVAPFARKISYG
uniref:TFIIS-type domain-containing protein n=1 Tax=Mycena chlorophos TaxID=658473 RepID=A0ABQ0LXH2_MYCCL|nr:predicted protein [Mycena chlorophos]